MEKENEGKIFTEAKPLSKWAVAVALLTQILHILHAVIKYNVHTVGYCASVLLC